ncbi:MATE family efflux transporter [Paracoccaceae bacterium]|nr:MATE family efflux transporter [Paracoccaceae bacterium]
MKNKSDLLSAPIGSTVFKLAIPNMITMSMWVITFIIEGWYVGQLGVVPLGGLALGFPMLFLLLMLSAGTIGGAITGLVAQKIGANDIEAAEKIAFSGLILTLCLGIISAIIFLLFGKIIYSSLGARNEVLDEVLRYSNVLFSGSFTIWIANGMAGVVRATGNMFIAALFLGLGSLVQVILGGIFIFGLGPIQSMGISGSSLSIVFGNGFAAVCILFFLIFKCETLKLRLLTRFIDPQSIISIVKQGSLASINAFCTWGSVVVITSYMTNFGVQTLAGYGIGARLEFLIIPVVFGFGAASTALIGINIGANNLERALNIGWIATLYSALAAGLIGFGAYFYPNFWSNAFTSDQSAQEVCKVYLETVGPFYIFFASGLCLYFASQGAGKVLWPAIAAIIRFLIVLIGSISISKNTTVSIDEYFSLISIAFLVQALITSSAIYFGAWNNRTKTQNDGLK